MSKFNVNLNNIGIDYHPQNSLDHELDFIFSRIGEERGEENMTKNEHLPPYARNALEG